MSNLRKLLVLFFVLCWAWALSSPSHADEWVPVDEVTDVKADLDPPTRPDVVYPDFPLLEVPGGDDDDDAAPPPSEEYGLDANDFLSMVFSDSLTLNINGLEAEPIHYNTVMKFEFTPFGEGVDSPLYLVLLNPEGGKFDIRLAVFNPDEYRLTLTIPTINGTRKYDLPSGSRILLEAHYLEMVKFAGEDTPLPGVPPEEQIPVIGAKAWMIVVPTGELLWEARVNPEDFTPPDVPQPKPPQEGENNPPPIVVNPPSGNNQPIDGGTPQGGGSNQEVPLDGVTSGVISGGGVGCTLGSQETGSPFAVLVFLPIIGWFILRRTRSAEL